MSFLGPFDAAAMLMRLQAHVSVCKVFGLATDLEAAIKNPPAALPAGYLVISERAADSSGLTGLLMQDVSVQVEVVWMVRNHSPAAALADMRAVIEQGRSALLGWHAPDTDAPMTAMTKQDIQYSGGVLISSDVFRTSYTIQRTV
ncbi:MAG: hypothetical protein U1F26_10870 [Lysobacterales bacterium]